MKYRQAMNTSTATTVAAAATPLRVRLFLGRALRVDGLELPRRNTGGFGRNRKILPIQIFVLPGNMRLKYFMLITKATVSDRRMSSI
jgi:hypothetical protein